MNPIRLRHLWQALAILAPLAWTACSGSGVITGTAPAPTAVGGPGDAAPQALPVAAAANAMDGRGAGILSAPADDDNIQKGGNERMVHFEAFVAPDFRSSLQKDAENSLASAQNRFLIGVAREREVDCHSTGRPDCWEWLDPNLLQGLTLRVIVKREPLDMIFMEGQEPPEEERCGDFYQDLTLTEKKPEGHNLSLEGMKLRERDLVSLVLFRRPPEFPPYSAVPVCSQGPHEKSAKVHILGTYEIYNPRNAPIPVFLKP